MKKVYVVGGDTYYASFLHDYILVDSVKDADIVIFTGGEDVDPSFYGAKKHPTTYSNIARDKYEKEVFDSIPKDKLVVGICRGAQWLCVMNGYPLYQNVVGHALAHTHQITNGKLVFEITSTHHQMQHLTSLSNKDYDILFYANECYHNPEEFDDDPNGQFIEPEIVLYHKDNLPKCLAIQGHPEMMRKDAPVVTMINELINQL